MLAVRAKAKPVLLSGASENREGPVQSPVHHRHSHGPHAGPGRSGNTRRLLVRYAERITARRRPWVPQGKRRCLPDRLHPRRAARRKQLRSGDPRASLGTGDDATTGPRGPDGLSGALQEHRPGPLPRAALKQEVPTAIPAQPSETPSRETSKGTARELVLHGGPGPYRAVR